LFDPSAPCSHSLSVSAAPVAIFYISLLLTHSFASSGFGTSFPAFVIFSVISLCTAVVYALYPLQESLVISLYSFNGSSFLPLHLVIGNYLKEKR
jgi:hypothetical protein